MSGRERRATGRAARVRSRAWWRRPAAYAGAVAVIALLALGLVLRGIRSETSGLSAEAAVPCSGTEMLSYHIHAHLEIDIRGAQPVVPANTGHRSNS